MSRAARMLAVLDCYPDVAASGVAPKRIVEECCRRIPQMGVTDGGDPADALEMACESAMTAMGEDRLRGPAIANFIVAAFRKIVVEGIKVPADRISRVGLRTLDEEIAKLEAEWAVRRAEEAKRPLPDPALPKRALESLASRRPDPDAWHTGTGPTRRRLPPRRPVAPETSEPTRVGKLVDGDTAREARELADAEAQWRRT